MLFPEILNIFQTSIINVLDIVMHLYFLIHVPDFFLDLKNQLIQIRYQVKQYLLFGLIFV